jgi:5-methylcytosine-specific restriction endonuclease McrA
MIRVHRTPKPVELTDQIQHELTEKYKALTVEERKTSKGAVWRLDYIYVALDQMSCSKCVYCECKLGEQGNNLTADHWLPKKIYLDLIVDWDNLLPACSRCNTQKNDHDPNVEDLLDPTFHDPKEHLCWTAMGSTLRGKTAVGQFSVIKLNLNHPQKLTPQRAQLAAQVQQTIEDLHSRTVNLNTPKELAKIQKGVLDVLIMALPNSKFSALVASAIKHDPLWQPLRDYMIQSGIWTLDHADHENVAFSNALEVRVTPYF